jgi:hypothetical protein
LFDWQHHLSLTDLPLLGKNPLKKNDVIMHQMRHSDIHICLVQETWLEGKSKIFKQLWICDHAAFPHGDEDTTCL